LDILGDLMKECNLELIRTNLRRYTFENKKFKKWVETNSNGNVLNLFAGKTKLDLKETRIDSDVTMDADFYMDAVDAMEMFIKEKTKFDTIILDPPYAYRKSMEMYNGHYTSRFKMLADLVPRVLSKDGKIISFGYHSTFMGKKRGFNLDKLCVFAHGGAQHCTIGIVESQMED
jgi:tRNA G10  N-methylase Trm11